MTTAKRTDKNRRAPRISFDVTKDHMANAVPKDSGHCMIADALMEAYPNAESVAVDLATIRFSDREQGRRYVYLTPLQAQHALLNFDAGVMPEPFHVTANAAQIIETSASARKRRAKGDLKKPGKGSPAKLVPPERHATATSTPAKEGGRIIPVGPLAGGPGAQVTLAKEEKRQAEAIARDPEGAAEAMQTLAEGKKLPPNSEFRTGRRREFGIRLMGR